MSKLLKSSYIMIFMIFFMFSSMVLAFDWNYDNPSESYSSSFELNAVTSMTYLKVNDVLSLKMPQAIGFDKKNNIYVGTMSGLYMTNYTSKAVSTLYKGNITGITTTSKGHILFVDHVKTNINIYNVTTKKVSVYYDFKPTSSSGNPYAITVDSSDNVYMSMDCECAELCQCPIHKLTISTMTADSYFPKFSQQNSFGITMSLDNKLYVSDSGNCRIYMIDTVAGTNPVVIAGTRALDHTGDGGKATKAAIYYPRGLAIDSDGNLFIAEGLGHTIRRIDKSGYISTYAGIYNASKPAGGYSGTGIRPNNTMLSCPYGLALDSTSSLIIADYGNNLVRGVYYLPASPTAVPTLSPNIFSIAAGDTKYGNLIALWVILALLSGIAVAIYVERKYYPQDFNALWSKSGGAAAGSSQAGMTMNMPVSNPLQEDDEL